MSTRFKLRRGTASAWTSANPTLLLGEPGIETDTLKWKVGDGSTAWNSLAYFNVSGAAAVSSVFGRTGAVVAVTGDYGGVVAAFLTGATSASRYVGATTSGAPVSGTFATGDFIIARDGHVFVCTSGGTPGTWADVGSGASFATPSIVLGSSAASGSAGTVIRSDSTIAAFDATSPTTQAFGDAAAVGTAAFAARRDHKHAMPATPVTSIAKSGSSAITGAATVSAGANISLTQVGSDISIAASSGGGGGSGFVATDVIWDTKGDLAAATGADAAVKVPAGANYTALYSDSSATPGVAWYPGAPVLLYDYEVTGSDKASIDTGVDTPSAGVAGTAAFPALRTLEVWLYVRTDETVLQSQVNVNLNNDGSSIYDAMRVSGTDSSAPGSAPNAGIATWAFLVSGASVQANAFGVVRLTMPNYAGTVGYKTAESLTATLLDSTSANNNIAIRGNLYRSTSAVNRLAVTPNVAGKKLKVGTRLLIYAR